MPGEYPAESPFAKNFPGDSAYNPTVPGTGKSTCICPMDGVYS